MHVARRSVPAPDAAGAAIAATPRHGIVRRHDPLLLNACHATPLRLGHRQEGRAALRRHYGEPRVVRRQSPFPENPVGHRDVIDDAGQGPFLRQPAQQGSGRPLAPATRFRRVGWDVLDTEPRQGRPTWIGTSCSATIWMELSVDQDGDATSLGRIVVVAD